MSRHYRDAVQNAFDNLNIENAANNLADYCHGLAKECGWWATDRNVGEMIALCHSELSEALEAHRKDKMDDHLPDRKGIEVELADAVIRIFDLAGGLGLDIGAAMAAKLAYNANRADHKPENRAKEGGKKF